jgi:hypothetical protein
MSSWNWVREEVREVVWLASVVTGLSVAGISLAIILRMAMSS